MLTMKRSGLIAVAVSAAVSLLLATPRAHAASYADRGAGIVILPKIVVDRDTDTLIRLINVDRFNATAAHCFYVNANYHCSNTGDVCEPLSSYPQCVDNLGYRGSCDPGWLEIDFRVVLTANQPLTWKAEEGLAGSQLPCPSPGSPGCGNQSNAGTRVPPVPEVPFIGELKCIQVSTSDFRPVNENDLAGSATVERLSEAVGVDPAWYNAVGLRSVANNGDGELIIGGNGEREYEGCSAVLVVNHMFDGAEDPIEVEEEDNPDAPEFDIVFRTELTLVPCSQDFLTQELKPVVAQFLVFNEFEQRFSTSRTIRCLLDSQLSLIDTFQPERSIFHASVSGTVAGQTRITGVNGGLIGSAILHKDVVFDDPGGGFGGTKIIRRPSASAGYNIHQSGEMLSGDRIRIP